MSPPRPVTSRHSDSCGEVAVQPGGSSAPLAERMNLIHTRSLPPFNLLFPKEKMSAHLLFYTSIVFPLVGEKESFGPWECVLKFASPLRPSWRCALLVAVALRALLLSDGFSSQCRWYMLTWGMKLRQCGFLHHLLSLYCLSQWCFSFRFSMWLDKSWHTPPLWLWLLPLI